MTRSASNNIDVDRLSKINQLDGDQVALPAENAAYKTVEGMASYRSGESAAHKNMHRLRTERLAREASAPPTLPRARKKRQK